MKSRLVAIVVLALGACSFTNSLDEHGRDYGKPSNDAGPGGSGGQEASSSDAPIQPSEGGAATFCSQQAQQAQPFFCDDFERTNRLEVGWSVNENGTASIDFDDALHFSGTRSVRATLAPGLPDAISQASLGHSFQMPHGKIRVRMAVRASTLEKPEALILNLDFGDLKTLAITIGGPYGMRLIERGGTHYQETGSVPEPVAESWAQFDARFDGSNKSDPTFTLDLDGTPAIRTVHLNAAPFPDTVGVAVGITYTKSDEPCFYNIDDVLVTEE